MNARDKSTDAWTIIFNDNLIRKHVLIFNEEFF